MKNFLDVIDRLIVCQNFSLRFYIHFKLFSPTLFYLFIYLELKAFQIIIPLFKFIISLEFERRSGKNINEFKWIQRNVCKRESLSINS